MQGKILIMKKTSFSRTWIALGSDSILTKLMPLRKWQNCAAQAPAQGRVVMRFVLMLAAVTAIIVFAIVDARAVKRRARQRKVQPT